MNHKQIATYNCWAYSVPQIVSAVVVKNQVSAALNRSTHMSLPLRLLLRKQEPIEKDWGRIRLYRLSLESVDKGEKRQAFSLR